MGLCMLTLKDFAGCISCTPYRILCMPLTLYTCSDRSFFTKKVQVVWLVVTLLLLLLLLLLLFSNWGRLKGSAK